jgi:hypothetical protein
MVRITRLYGQPTGYYMKIVYKSHFPTSNANLDSRIGFYAKFYVGVHSTGGGSMIPYDTRAAAGKKTTTKNGISFPYYHQ